MLHVDSHLCLSCTRLHWTEAIFEWISLKAYAMRAGIEAYALKFTEARLASCFRGFGPHPRASSIISELKLDFFSLLLRATFSPLPSIRPTSASFHRELLFAYCLEFSSIASWAVVSFD
ncbi:hypothetical protein IEQ34_013203 [Dendrobium chrysotoxum]|uniref:Uncharacterized protein n=1 Tax=Dendrobium chrysotoxum TaxID=161865 RepID=A0AAV7GQC9_DENCH|nr:hypothetical protein IEQ34_013203 [Dendrobium chrysotoxum]